MIELWGIQITTENTWTGESSKEWYRDAEDGAVFADTAEVCEVVSDALRRAPPRLAVVVKPLPLPLWPLRYQMAALIEAVRFLADVAGARERQ